ncbi:MAG: glycosyltransferase family 8 protein [Oscillospiraceae bacterium]|nr:glycosyltransferase family 8 protein [Oscillospiraceae bacterium]
MNLLFTLNRGYLPVFLPCLQSVMTRGGADNYDIYVLHSDLEDGDKLSICRTAGDKGTCHFILVDPAIFADFPETKRYPKQIYYRLAAPSLLPEDLDRILYLDGDTIIINPLLELYDTDFEGSYLMACTHIRRLLGMFNQVRLSLEEDVPYINTGVMMMNLPALREHLHLEDIQTYALENRHILMLPDQDIVTALYGQHIKLMDSLRYNLSDRLLNHYNADPTHMPKLDLEWVRSNTSIIHYYGRNKPWGDQPYIGILDVFYCEATGTEPSEGRRKQKARSKTKKRTSDESDEIY